MWVVFHAMETLVVAKCFTPSQPLASALSGADPQDQQEGRRLSSGSVYSAADSSWPTTPQKGFLQRRSKVSKRRLKGTPQGGLSRELWVAGTVAENGPGHLGDNFPGLRFIGLDQHKPEICKLGPRHSLCDLAGAGSVGDIV